jgi:hypothetical protein
LGLDQRFVTVPPDLADDGVFRGSGTNGFRDEPLSNRQLERMYAVWLSSCTSVATALDDCGTDKERMLPRCVIGPMGRPSTMPRVGSSGFVVVLALVLSTPVIRAQAPAASTQQPPASPAGAANARDLANQVNNPAAPVTLLQFRNILLPAVDGADGVTNEFEIQPVLPIGPFAKFPHLQLVKMTMPFPSLPSPVGVAGTGDLEVFDLLVFKRSWGQWGLGPVMVFPTASDESLGAGKWQAGPAFAVIYTGIKNLTAGAIFQNQVSFAGDKARLGVNTLVVTPAVTYNLEDGWFAGLSDFDWEFDWKNGGDATVLLGAQVGRIFRVGHQAFSLSIEVGGAAAKASTVPSPGWIIGLEFSPIFKGHIK